MKWECYWDIFSVVNSFFFVVTIENLLQILYIVQIPHTQTDLCLYLLCALRLRLHFMYVQLICFSALGFSITLYIVVIPRRL